jgi:ribosomal protein S18 acetylase RimI-like enzyme
MAIIVREASPEDALLACEVLRRSIRELCAVDHKNDEKALAEWLENKTADNVRRWLASPSTYGVVAERDGTVCGFAMVGKDGTISLCYVLPDVHHSGAGKKMLAELEAQAARWKLTSLGVESTLTAKPFYERNGYVSTGESVPVKGSHGGYSLQKVLGGGAHQRA